MLPSRKGDPGTSTVAVWASGISSESELTSSASIDAAFCWAPPRIPAEARFGERDAEGVRANCPVGRIDLASGRVCVARACAVAIWAAGRWLTKSIESAMAPKTRGMPRKGPRTRALRFQRRAKRFCFRSSGVSKASAIGSKAGGDARMCSSGMSDFSRSDFSRIAGCVPSPFRRFSRWIGPFLGRHEKKGERLVPLAWDLPRVCTGESVGGVRRRRFFPHGLAQG